MKLSENFSIYLSKSQFEIFIILSLISHRYSDEIFPNYCKIPTTVQEIESSTKHYTKNGLPGCIGSIDCTKISWWDTPYNLKQLHKDCSGSTTKKYEIVVDHERKCLSCTAGFYGSYNDKNVAKFDTFLMKIHQQRFYEDIEYTLFDRNGNQIKQKGLYLISDNGYFNWRCLQFPYKRKGDVDNMYYHKWSKRVESIRKDVECFFGILKKRFEIIHHGIRLRSATQMDCVVKTCCTFHNQLLEYDKEFGDYDSISDEIFVDHDVDGAHGGHENHIVDDEDDVGDEESDVGDDEDDAGDDDASDGGDDDASDGGDDEDDVGDDESDGGDDESDLGDDDENESDNHLGDGNPDAGDNNHAIGEVVDDGELVNDGDVPVRSKSYILPNQQIEAIKHKELADQLVAHFSYLYDNGLITWNE